MKNTKSMTELLAGVDTSYLSEAEKATLVARAQSTEYALDAIFSVISSIKKALNKISLTKSPQHA